MCISRSTRPLSKFYSLCNTILSEVNCAQYLGINITSDLQWSNHISGISSQANSSLGFIRRNLRSCPQKLKEVAYISMVRSVMEYNAIWHPHFRKDIDLLERIQRRAARFVKTDYNPRSSVTRMMQDLGWSDLAHRRTDLRLALLYKVVFCDYVVMAKDLQLVKADKRTRSNHPNKLRHIWADSTEPVHFFLVNTMEDWNHLPASVIASPSLASFKTRLAQRERVDTSTPICVDIQPLRTADYHPDPDPDHLPETSGTLWIHRGALTNQQCSLATGCGITSRKTENTDHQVANSRATKQFVT